MDMQTHPRKWGKSPCREQEALRSCRSLRVCELRQCMWALCSSEQWAWFLPPPEGTWPGQQQRQPVHQLIWLSTERWSPVRPCEGGQSWTQRKAKLITLNYTDCTDQQVNDYLIYWQFDGIFWQMWVLKCKFLSVNLLFWFNISLICKIINKGGKRQTFPCSGFSNVRIGSFFILFDINWIRAQINFYFHYLFTCRWCLRLIVCPHLV